MVVSKMYVEQKMATLHQLAMKSSCNSRVVGLSVKLRERVVGLSVAFRD